LYSIVHEEPQAISGFRPDIPGNLASFISKTLQKDPRQRYQTARELVGDLKAAMAPGIQLPKQEKSIVVLPFDDLSPDRDQEYFSDGLTEEVISDLSAVRALRVISRSSAMTFKGTKKKIPEIAREVNVQYVLEGSVRKAGNNLRITAQLIDAQNDAHLWAEKYSGTLDDVFDIQETVSRAIVNALMLKLTPEEDLKMGQRPFDDVRAYECYLKAHAEVLKMSGEAINRAIQYLQDALDIIGHNAFLYSGMAWAYFMLVNIGLKQEDYIVRAEECARKALTLDPEFAQAHATLGWISAWSDTRQAVYHLKKALSVSADDTLALQGLAMVYVSFVGKVGAAIPLCERLLQIDPFDLPTKWHQGGIHFYDGQYDLALPPWQRLYDESPELPVAQFYYALTRASLGQMHEALSITTPAAGPIRSDAFSKTALMLRHAILRDRNRVFQEMTPDFQKTARRDAPFSHHLAEILALLGEKNEALDWLQNAIDRGFINYPMLAEKDPLLANIRGEERFKKLMERVKKEWEEFEV
jgi:non-specific serine/threonine protein kinase